MPRPGAWIIGDVSPGDTNVEKFRSEVERVNRTVHKGRIADCGRVQREDLVLLLHTSDVRNIRGAARAAAGMGARVMVYAEDDCCSGQLAVELCKSGVADVLVHDRRVDPARFGSHASKLHDGGEIYPRYKLAPLGPGSRVFVATPYFKELRQEMASAVDSALCARGLAPSWADEYVCLPTVGGNVKKLIKKSRLVIANISLCKPKDSRHNPNVYFELGLAEGLHRKMILIRPLSDKKGAVPIDIRGRIYLEYANEVDLAVQLYFGLRP